MSTAPRDATTDVDMGYKDPAPWTFTGKALYQLALVRAEDARAHVPSDLRLVEFAGHTLGGLYVARYDESPCGKLDEVVVLGGLVWNPPTSCAWASRVYVDSAEARAHFSRAFGSRAEARSTREIPIQVRASPMCVILRRLQRLSPSSGAEGAIHLCAQQSRT